MTTTATYIPVPVDLVARLLESEELWDDDGPAAQELADLYVTATGPTSPPVEGA